jgi:myo-inositol-1-phosphate synthase
LKSRTGVWVIGARGGIATCIYAGLTGIAEKFFGTEGLVTEMADFADLGLVALDDLVFGGHEIRGGTLRDSAEEIRQRAGTLSPEVIAAAAERLDAIDSRIRPGTALGCGKAITGLSGVTGLLEEKQSPSEIVETLTADMQSFQADVGTQRLVVLNISSTEPFRESMPTFTENLADFETALAAGDPGLSAGMLYAYAAFKAGAAYVNFTPSVGSEVPALRQLAEKEGLPHCGKDGRTGETLLKTAMAPMFVERNLRVLSWESYNIFGNRDAEVLDDPVNNLAKTKGKDAALRNILGDERTHTRVRIDYCPSLDDWKTAWNFIHFQGFGGTKMTLQFIWQGCDSMLAAPLAIDMMRLSELALGLGESGVMEHMSAFFKQPVDGDRQDFFRQSRKLEAYVKARSKKTNC